MAIPLSKRGPLHALLILHKAMLAAQLIFSTIIFYFVYTGSFTECSSQLNEILQVIAVFFSGAGYFFGSFLFKRNIAQTVEIQTGAKDKFSIYRQACILQWALIEGPSLFAAVCLFLTGNYAFLALAIVLMLLFAMMAPSRLKMVFQLKLSEAETDKL